MKDFYVFMIRLWGSKDNQEEMRGRVECVNTGKKTYFNSFDQLKNFLTKNHPKILAEKPEGKSISLKAEIKKLDEI